MTDLLALDQNLVPLLGILCTAVVAVVWVGAAYYRSVQVAEMDSALKMEMVQRGMSAEDIERVLHAHSVHASDDCGATQKKVATFKLAGDKRAQAT
jgi:hypothetical protein